VAPLLTVLNFSAGRQSSALLHMVIRGEIPRPASFVVVRANPGMESAQTLEYAEGLERDAAAAGIEVRVAPGPNLYEDLVTIRSRSRVDNPPFWTPAREPDQPSEAQRRARTVAGQLEWTPEGFRPTTPAPLELPVGQLQQKCTTFYKIAPMDRVVREVLEERHGIARNNDRPPAGCVEKWIGYGLDELHRASTSKTKMVAFRYPLAEMGFTKARLLDWYRERGLPIPPPSHCNACFSQGLRALQDMHDHRPADWAQAVAVDDAVRDMTSVGVDRPVFVSRTLRPLRELAARGFQLDSPVETDLASCDSGACFL
jgi:hypothetical protein